MGHKLSSSKSADSKQCCGPTTGQAVPSGKKDAKPVARADNRAPVALPRAPDASGWALPSRYQVNKSIGKGSYGSVCECYDHEKKVSVAIKQLKGLFDDLVDAKRILRETAILTRLRSECVVRVHDIIVPNDINTFNELYIALEICDSDMKKLVRTDVMLSPLHINTLLYNLLVGLKYIHSAGVYHRDLKPANCLVNQNCSVKICDFGLARAIGGEGAQMNDQVQDEDDEQESSGAPVVPSTLRKKRVMTQHVVTRWYRAPELILLQKGYTEAIDIWSVGCIFGELLQMQEEAIRFADRGPVFPGSSCFPLSPERKKSVMGGQKSRGKNDQLEVIFGIIGTPSDQEASMLESEDARRYVQSFPTMQGEGVKSRFPNVGSEAHDLLDKMLRFLPQDRLKVQQALEHPLLQPIRDPACETTAAGPVVLQFEKEGRGPNNDLSEGQLRKLFAAEMKTFHEKR